MAFRTRCRVAGLADLDAERDETPDSRLDTEPAGPALESVEAKTDNGKNDNARKYSQHNGTLQPHTPRVASLHPAGCDPWPQLHGSLSFARCCVLVCRCLLLLRQPGYRSHT